MGRAAVKAAGEGSFDLAGEYVANGSGRNPGAKNATTNLAFEGGVNAMTAEGFRVLIDEARRGKFDSIRFLARACPRGPTPSGGGWFELVSGVMAGWAEADPRVVF
ncbi:MAG: hypothetical protein OEM67_07050 [Thermoleophilia bacterium]|nr:hypothetical protein [Thermoleophilia bacterium]MDH3725083.1 hypothetical protein [Thermoleophilia bacterium]